MKRQFWLGLLLVVGTCLVPLVAALPIGRWWGLQRLGQVPESAVLPLAAEWRIAPWTTWWGKPLDPKKFWRGRVIWNDTSAGTAAQRHGRGYPPIPVHVPNLVKDFAVNSRSQKDIVPGPFSGGLDSGPVIPFHYTDAESAYWDWFWRNQPKPPATLEREQFEVAETILRMRRPLVIRGRSIHEIPARELAAVEATQKSRAQEIGVPVEALSEEALLWAYVMRKRQEYAKEEVQAAGWKSINESEAERSLKSFLERLAVNTKFITDPLTSEQAKAAKAWKFAYLQRLWREKVDGSYISAYLEAWELPPSDIFREDKSRR